MSNIEFFIIDTETTGLDAVRQEIVEISIIRCSDRKQLSRTIKAEHPDKASYEALKITGKTIADIMKGDAKEDVVAACNKFLNETGSPNSRCIVGHNIIGFDKKFLFALWDKCGQEFPANLWMDTLLMMKKEAKDRGLIKPSLKLQASCDIVGARKTAQQHTAKDDTRSNYFLWQKLMENKFDYLPFIKTFEHKPKPMQASDEDELLGEMNSFSPDDD